MWLLLSQLEVCNKGICDIKSQLLYIMSDKIRVWLTIMIQSLKNKVLRLESTLDWIEVEIFLSVMNSWEING